MPEIFFVYLLKCWEDEESMKRKRPIDGHRIYCGQTNNIFRRLVEHITGQSFYTSQFKGNVKLSYLEAYYTRAEAMNREDEIKGYSRDQKVALIQGFEVAKKKELKYIEESVQKLL